MTWSDAIDLQLIFSALLLILDLGVTSKEVLLLYLFVVDFLDIFADFDTMYDFERENKSKQWRTGAKWRQYITTTN